MSHPPVALPSTRYEQEFKNNEDLSMELEKNLNDWNAQRINLENSLAEAKKKAASLEVQNKELKDTTVSPTLLFVRLGASVTYRSSPHACATPQPNPMAWPTCLLTGDRREREGH